MYSLYIPLKGPMGPRPIQCTPKTCFFNSFLINCGLWDASACCESMRLVKLVWKQLTRAYNLTSEAKIWKTFLKIMFWGAWTQGVGMNILCIFLMYSLNLRQFRLTLKLDFLHVSQNHIFCKNGSHVRDTDIKTPRFWSQLRPANFGSSFGD